MNFISGIILMLASSMYVFGSPSENEVDELVEEIRKLQKKVEANLPDKDFSRYFEGYDENAECVEEGTYDFIIVGAGSSGSVLTNRLSENKNWTILVLEQGKEENNITDIPGMLLLNLASEYMIPYTTTPLDKYSNFINKSGPLQTGRALGGSSVVNLMMYVRGNKEDYNRWADLGNPGWSYEEILPYFKRSERATFPNADPKYRGLSGTLNVEYAHHFDELGETYLEAEQQLGARILEDYNGENQIGAAVIQFNTRNGMRDSAARAFLFPVYRRENLIISPNTFVLKILINTTTKEAYGVQYLREGKCFISKCSKEVILSAGVFGSPRLLMLSGIGPRAHLENLNIPVIQDSPIGESFWTHSLYATRPLEINIASPANTFKENIREYLEGRGFFTTPVGTQAISFVNLTDSSSDVPDVELVFVTSDGYIFPYEVFRNAFYLTPESYDNLASAVRNKYIAAIAIIILHPKSRGTMRLRSKSPVDFPLFDIDIFQYQEDVDVIARGAKYAANIFKTPAFRSIIDDPSKVNWDLPDCRSFSKGSDEHYRCEAAHILAPIQHWGSTCRMGPRRDKMAAVDARFRVYGVRNLRVIDTSVIPVTISGHTNAIAYVIGEKGSDILKEEYGYPIERE